MKRTVTILSVIGILATGLFPLTTTAKTGSSNATHLFYYYPNTTGYDSLTKNYRDIDILAPQLYTLGYDYSLGGPKDEKAVTFAKKKKMKVMPLVYNANFDKALMTRFLLDEEAQDDFIDDLIKEAKKRKYIGWQFDFENINHLDRQAYVDFVEKASKAFKKKKLQFSVAVIPRTTDYDRFALTQDWSSGYDIGAIAKHADFITIMSYDNPLSRGPVASLGYVKNVLTHTLKTTPAEKISLGIPYYCWQWNMNTGTKIADITYDLADSTKKTYKNNNYSRNYPAEYETEFISFTKDNGEIHNIWCDNERSVKTKIDLAKTMKLHGTSAWALGQEDPKVWKHY